MPVECVGEDSAEQDAERAASGRDEAEDAHRLRPLGRVDEQRHHQRERATAETTAPPTPCTARAATSMPWEFARPHTADAAVKSATPARNKVRCPRRSPSRPPRSRKPPNVIR